MKKYAKEPIYFIAAKRSPFGTYLGSLAHLSATELGAHAAKAALAEIGLPPTHTAEHTWPRSIV